MLTILRKASDSLLHSPFPERMCACTTTVSLFHINAPLSKHYNPKFRKERAAKVLKIVLPDFDEKRRDEKLSMEELRSKLKEKGIGPSRNWNEKPMYISCTSDIFERYVPPEGDGKMSAISSSGAKQMYDAIGKKGKSYLALRKIRNIDYDFDVPSVAEQGQRIFIDAQEALTDFRKNEDKLHDLVTEKAYPEMIENVSNKTIAWKFVQSLEPPRIVHIRCNEMMSKENLFAQVTVRMHTRQILAVYDRFGRLMHGSEDTVKDVLEYVVLEKHITHPNAVWRIHGKIIPDWLPPKEAIKKTYYLPDFEKEFPEPPPEFQEKLETSKGSDPVPAIA